MSTITSKIKKIAIANRGEVAVRIHRACKALGYKTVLLHSEPDTQSLAYRLCDETFCIGPGPSLKSYLNIKAVVDGASKTECLALHPGFGFLSENAEFARACAKAGILFIGPSADSMDLFGDKISAKNFCEDQKVPTLPSYRGSDISLKTLKLESEKLGYPVLVKAAAGGGGRGMRVVDSPKDLASQLESAQGEALKAFGSDQVFLEKYLPEAKHIEVQIFGSHTGEVFVFGERECSIQRRHQKVIEEALSPNLSEKERLKVYKYAHDLAKGASYQNAGTVEFLFAGGEFYFLEVNTRLQVEHPVTEEVYGIDLVQAQIKNTFKQNPFETSDFTPQGHSIECRIYAENLKGLPSLGTLSKVYLPKEARLEVGFEPNDTIGPYYDSMIAKVIVTAPNREEARLKTLKGLKTSFVSGVETNIPLLIQILEHPDFISGIMSTKFFEKHFPEGLENPFSEAELINLARQIERSHMGHDPFSKAWRPGLNSPTSTGNIDHQNSITWVGKEGWSFPLSNYGRLRKRQKSVNSTSNGNILSPMPGQLIKILVSEGQRVMENDNLCVVEAMKMEHSLKAPFNGTVADILFQKGDALNGSDLILKIEPSNTEAP